MALGVETTAMLFKINGIPAHPLIVHGAVVLVPIACLGALAYLNPRWRDWLRWPLLVTAVLSFVFIWAAYLSGDNFKESVSFFQGDEQIEKHEEYADVFRIVGSAFSLAVIAVMVWLHGRKDTVRTVAAGVTAALAVVTLVYVFLTGEAGAKATYPPEGFSDAAASAPVVAGS